MIDGKAADFEISESAFYASEPIVANDRTYELCKTLACAVDRQRALSGWKNAYAVFGDNGVAKILEGRGHPQVYERHSGSTWISQGWYHNFCPKPCSHPAS